MLVGRDTMPAEIQAGGTHETGAARSINNRDWSGRLLRGEGRICRRRAGDVPPETI
jgi:hypothetical protein